MKILKSIGLYFVYPVTMFLLGFFTHVWYIDFFYPNKNTDITFPNTMYTEQKMNTVANTPQQITTCDTDYIIVEYNVVNNTQNQSFGQLPEKYLGMTRQQLENELKEYELSPNLEDQEKGFVSLQLQSFSRQQVVLQKNYRPIEKKITGYYLMVQDGKIVVMEEDKQTVYLTTDIYAEALSDVLRQELIQGKFIYDIEELYGFLESYTS